MPSPKGMQDTWLPSCFNPLAGTNSQIPKRRCSEDHSAQKFDVTLSVWDRGVEMRYRISIAHFENAEIGGSGQQMRPAYLKKIEMVDLWLSEESARQNEGRRQAVTSQRCETGRHSAIGDVDPRAAVQS